MNVNAHFLKLPGWVGFFSFDLICFAFPVWKTSIYFNLFAQKLFIFPIFTLQFSFQNICFALQTCFAIKFLKRNSIYGYIFRQTHKPEVFRPEFPFSFSNCGNLWILQINKNFTAKRVDNLWWLDNFNRICYKTDELCTHVFR